MADTVTWDLLRELAEFRAARGCALSFYFKLDPSEVPTQREIVSRVTSLLDDARRKGESMRPELVVRQLGPHRLALPARVVEQRGHARDDLALSRNLARIELEVEAEGAAAGGPKLGQLAQQVPGDGVSHGHSLPPRSDFSPTLSR